MSVAGVHGTGCACSGAMYAGVPRIEPGGVIRVISAAVASPRSPSLTAPWSPTSTLAGLTSRCTMSVGVRVVERGGDGPQQLERALGVQRRVLEHVGERAARDVLHDEEEVVVLREHVEHRHEVRVVQRGHDPRLPAQPLRRRLGHLGAVQALDRDLAPERLVLGQEDGGRAAGAQPSHDPVAPAEERRRGHGQRALPCSPGMSSSSLPRRRVGDQEHAGDDEPEQAQRRRGRA